MRSTALVKHNHNGCLAIALAGAVFLSFSCSAKLKVRTKSGGPAPAEEPTTGPVTTDQPASETPPIEAVVKTVRQIALTGNDLYIQSRSHLRIPLSSEFSDGSVLTLIHKKTKIETPASELGYASCSGTPCLSFAAKHSAAGSDFLNYGLNEFELLAIQTTEDLKSTLKITLKDTPVFGPVALMTVDAESGTVVGQELRPLVSNLMPAGSATTQQGTPESSLIGSWQEQIELP